MSKGKKRPPFSEEWKRKISESHKGLLVREKNHNFGKHLSEEIRKKISQSNKGKIRCEETRRKMSESRKGYKHPNWQGGISFEPYTIDFNYQFKEAIRQRDNRCCVVCNKPEEELNSKLDVHHIDYNKKNSFPQNCISLCRRHHMETNINRNSWKTFFQSLLKERYGYEYTIDQKMILDFTEKY